MSFSFRTELPNDSYIMCLVSVMVFAFWFQVAMWLPCLSMGAQPLGLHHHNPSEFTLGRHICLQVMVCGPCQECTLWLLLPLPLVREACFCSPHCSPAIPAIWYSLWLQGLGREPPDHCAFSRLWGSSFPVSDPPNDTADSKSSIGVRPDDSGVIIGYHNVKFTHTQSAEHFIVHSNIYPSFTG